MQFVVLAYFLPFSIALALSALHYVHMFQLESYLPRQFLRWMLNRTQFRRIVVFIPAFLSAFLMLFWPEKLLPVILSAFLMLFPIRTFFPYKAKKPLVYTARVKRMLATYTVVCILISVLCVHFDYVGLTALLLPLSGFMLLLANLINYPFEQAVRGYFINDAKKILKARKGTLVVIGITGSYGKTSTKFFLTELLSQKYNVLMTPASFNTTMGVVRVIREMLKPSHEIFVCEMGARTVGEIKEICDIVMPTYGIITSIGPQHLETFHSIENIVKTKFELADAVGENDHMVLNADNRYIYDRRYCDKYTYYGMTNTDAAYFGEDLVATSDGTSFNLRFPDGDVIALSARLLGQHNAMNIIASVAIADKFEIPRKDIVRAVRMLNPVPHRLQLVDGGDVTIIDDSFNSNPIGSRSALEALAVFDGVRVLVTPGMVELGESQSFLNYEFGVLAGKICQYIYVVGEVNYESIYNGVFSTGFDVDKRLIRVKSPEDAIFRVRSLRTDYPKIILLENDLPDNFR